MMFGWFKPKPPFRVVEYRDKRVAVEEWINSEVGGFYSEVASCQSMADALREIDRRKSAQTIWRVTEVS